MDVNCATMDGRPAPAYMTDEIRRQTRRNLLCLAQCPQEIDARLGELDQEWDLDRLLTAQAAGVSLVGVTMGLVGGRKWLALPALAAAMLMQHATHGWCPPATLLRRLGVRLRSEIEFERVALKALRGDFQAIGGRDQDPPGRVERAMTAADAAAGPETASQA